MLQYTIPMPLPGSEQLLFDAWLQPTAGAMAGKVSLHQWHQCP